MIKLVVDMMGGDNGSKPTLLAVKKFLKDYPDAQIIAVGNKSEISSLDGTKTTATSQNSNELPISTFFEKINNLSFSQVFKLGIILQWPILLGVLLIFSLILIVLLK